MGEVGQVLPRLWRPSRADSSHGPARLRDQRKPPHSPEAHTRASTCTHTTGSGAPTWLVQALHRYTQVPSPTLSTLRDDQSTRFR